LSGIDTPQATRGSPYQGLVPYEEDDAPWFFGRDKETRLIIANLFASPLTLLYGASGVGKSSVLGAGVVHQLRERAGLLVVPFKSWQGDPATALAAAVAHAALQATGGETPAAASSLSSDGLLECLTRVGRLGRRVMIILDQFEEYFLYHPQDDEFAEQFPAVLRRAELAVSFLLSVREDSWAKLDRFEARIPILFDNYLRIDYLDREAAISAVRKPLDEYNRQPPGGQEPVTIEDQLVQELLEEVRTGKVSFSLSFDLSQPAVAAATAAAMGVPTPMPVRSGSGGCVEMRIETPFLQMVLERLWHTEMAQGSRRMRLTTLRDLGGAERIVRTHLDKVMEKLGETERATAARVFRFLVTPSGAKVALDIPTLASWAAVDRAKAEPVMEKLAGAESRVLRAVAPPPDQPEAKRYEVYHDVLASSILDWRARYVRDQELIEAEQRAAREAAEREQKANREQQLTQERRLRRRLVALVVVLLVAIGATVYAWRQTNRVLLYEKEHRLQELLGFLPQTTIRFVARYAPEPGQKKYSFTVYPEKGSLPTGKDAVAFITYVFDDPSFQPNYFKTVGREQEFAVSYTGWGCLSTVVAVVQYADPEHAPSFTEFDMCKILKVDKSQHQTN